MPSDKLMWSITSEPFVELTLQAVKSRRSLLLCCLLAFGRMQGITIDGNIRVMEANVTGITPDLIDWLILSGVIYFTIMLFIHGFESLQKWKLRTTGITRHEYIASIGYMFQRSMEPEQGVAYKTFCLAAKKIEAEIDKAGTKAGLDKYGNNIINDLKSFTREWHENGDKLKTLETKFWRHQLTLVLRFAVLDYFGPLIVSLVTIIAMLHYLPTK